MNRRLVWSLLLAFLLPFAQAAAAAHEVAHAHEAARHGGAPVAQCELCLAAAAVTGGGAAPDVPVLIHAPAVAFAPPAWHEPAPRAQPGAAHFLSRAPPLAC